MEINAASAGDFASLPRRTSPEIAPPVQSGMRAARNLRYRSTAGLGQFSTFRIRRVPCFQRRRSVSMFGVPPSSDSGPLRLSSAHITEPELVPAMMLNSLVAPPDVADAVMTHPLGISLASTWNRP